MFNFGSYYTSTKAKNNAGRYALATLLGVLVFIHIGNLFGPPPPSVDMIAIAGNAMWLFVLWVWWVEKNREIKLNHN